ncbi:MAG: 4Fe-4S dicluster domain-containing protein [Dehalococcoidia bacterium]|nr:4Fe-4S dicluster domain-containing protein [Dehalococcoidia bacterium]MSQ35515.1 4Fe-4S dicluster domain-containing protein [Dehalococcoidia bacterium]
MAYPVLLWDENADEAACTGCMACVNFCPTKCMTATVARNPRHGAGQSLRKTVATTFTVKLTDCIECGICVDVCKYDAIALSYAGPPLARGFEGGMADMTALLRLGEKTGNSSATASKTAASAVNDKLKAAYDRLPPASESDAARRARSRLRNTKPIKADFVKRRPKA